MHYAAGMGSVYNIAVLIAMGFDVNEKDEAGRSPLFHAIGRDEHENVKMLITAGADTSYVDERGRSPLQYACDKRSSKSRKVLKNIPLPDDETKKLRYLIKAAKCRLASINAKQDYLTDDSQ